MVDWNTGALNARAVTLKLLIENFHNGDRIVKTLVNGDNVYGIGFLSEDGAKKLLLINKSIANIEVELSELPRSTTYIDVTTGNSIKSEKLSGKTVKLGGFAVHVIEF